MLAGAAETTSPAFAERECPSAASATCFALAVSRSTSELAALSVRSRIDANGAAIIPTCASKRAISIAASSASERTASRSRTDSPEIDAGTEARKGPRERARARRDIGASGSGSHGAGSRPVIGQRRAGAPG